MEGRPPERVGRDGGGSRRRCGPPHCTLQSGGLKCALLGTSGVASAAPAVPPATLRGSPAAVRGETSVVSTASCAQSQWQAVGNDLNAPVVLPDWVDVEVADKHIESDSRTSFAAHPGGSTLDKAGCKMVVVRTRA